jgi:hypothetical protein
MRSDWSKRLGEVRTWLTLGALAIAGLFWLSRR